MSPPSILIVGIVVSCTSCILALKPCPNCGHMLVPYPLSTGPSCGDQLYKIRCNAGTLWFNSLNGSYIIKSINPPTQSVILRPPGFANNKCMATDFQNQGIQLDSKHPFNISSSNTVLLMNCSSNMLQRPYNCSSTSICHDYIRNNSIAKAACGTSPICCWFMTSGSVDEYRIRVRGERCSAYQTFVDFESFLLFSRYFHFQCAKLNFLNKYSNGRGCKRRKSKAPVIGGLAGGVFLLGAVLIMLRFYKHYHQMNNREAEVSLTKVQKDISTANNSGRLARIFDGKEIIKATNNFSDNNLLGSGGFGKVFKCILDDGTLAVVKRATLGNTKAIDQILNKVRILCQVNHRSLVKLLGCCVELEQPLLVYEFVPNGTLFDHLHKVQYGKWPPLKWHHRLHIAQQTAQGIAYLHLLATPPIYHRDIKSTNILLDEKLEAKVSDFGMSRLAVNDVSHITTCAQGTLGYLDPEYYLNFQLTDKSDVYSFGVVLVEMLTSKKAVDFNREEQDVNLVVYFGKILKQERLMDAIDPMIKEGASDVELESMEAFASLAAACLDERRKNRPSMKDVAHEIERIISAVSSGA